MTSMLEVLREHKHLTARNKNEGQRPPSLEERLQELGDVIRANAPPANAPSPAPNATRVPKGDTPIGAPPRATSMRAAPRGASSASVSDEREISTPGKKKKKRKRQL